MSSGKFDHARVRKVRADCRIAGGGCVSHAFDRRRHTSLFSEEVLSVLRTGARVDLLFTDVGMPGVLDGIALARLVRAEFPDVKVVIASGNVVATEVGVAVDGFFSKPYHVTQLLGHIKALLPEEP